jgi:hypothetical protein
LSGSRAAGIFPVSSNAISENFYSTSDGCGEVKMQLQTDEGRHDDRISIHSASGLSARDGDDVHPLHALEFKYLLQSLCILSVQCPDGLQNVGKSQGKNLQKH